MHERPTTLDNYFETIYAEIYYATVLPCILKKDVFDDLVVSVKKQYKDLKKSAYSIKYRELAKVICDARQFSDDEEENWVLRLAYWRAFMRDAGTSSKTRSVKRKDHEAYLRAQEEEYERECHK